MLRVTPLLHLGQIADVHLDELRDPATILDGSQHALPPGHVGPHDAHRNPPRREQCGR